MMYPKILEINNILIKSINFEYGNRVIVNHPTLGIQKGKIIGLRPIAGHLSPNSIVDVELDMGQFVQVFMRNIEKIKCSKCGTPLVEDQFSAHYGDWCPNEECENLQ